MKKMDPSLTAYQNLIKGMNPERARLTINKLGSKVQRVMNKAHRAARKYEDCGPIDIASEQVAPINTIIMALEWYLINGTTEPTGALKTAVEAFKADNDERAERLENPRRTPPEQNLMGRTVYFLDKSRREISGVVINQRIHRRSGTLVYRLSNGWRISARSILRHEATPESAARTLENLDNLYKNTHGKTVEWRSKVGGAASGKVTKVGRTKLTVEAGAFRFWKVPFHLITKIDGIPVPKAG